MKRIIYILLLMLVLSLPTWATNTQDDGRTYFSVDQFSVNESGQGYGSAGTGTPFSYDGTGFVRLEFPTFTTIASTYTDDGLFFSIDWTSAGMGALTVVDTDVPIIGTGVAGNAVTLDYGVGLSVVAGELVNTVTDTDTDTTALVGGLEVGAVVLDSSATSAGYPAPMPVAGTATYVSAFLSVWGVVTGADVVTVTLWVNGSPTDSWITSAGSPDGYGGAVSEVITQNDYVLVKAQVTTVNGGLDNIEIQSYSVNLEIQ